MEEIKQYHKNYLQVGDKHGNGEHTVTILGFKINSKYVFVCYERTDGGYRESSVVFFKETYPLLVSINISAPMFDMLYGLETNSNHDPVNHPPHYISDPSGVECIQITRHRNFNIGNAIKYLWRAGLKGSDKEIQDLEKAIWYIQDEIKRLKGQ